MTMMVKALLVLLPFLGKAAFLRSAPIQFSADQKKTAHWGCKDACKPPSPVESACVTACEADFYQCNDVACSDAVLKKYEETKGVTKKEGNATKGNATKGEKKEGKKEKKKAALVADAPVVQLSAEQKKTAHWGCKDACKPPSPVESACVTACEADFYQCNDVACSDAVLKKYQETKGVVKKEGNATKGNATKGEKKEGKKEKKKAALVADAPVVQLSAEQKKTAHWGCKDACKPPSPVESACVTACEADFYQCNDVACSDAVLKKYEETKGVVKKEGNATKGNATKGEKKEGKKEKKKAALVADAPVVALKANQKYAHWGCGKACESSPAESKCVTNCETAFYQCNDVACQDKVLKQFETTKGVEKKDEKKKGKKGDEKKDKKDAKKEEKKK